MEKNTIIKLIIQYLNEKGFKEVSEKIEEETSVLLESAELRILQNLILEGKFEDAIKIILSNCQEIEILAIVPKIRIRQIFELILKEKEKSVEFIRKIASSQNIYEKEASIEKTIPLIFIKDPNLLRQKMRDLCSVAISNESLIEYIKSILNKSNSNLKTLYPGSLETMLDTVVKNQIKVCKTHNTKLNTFSYFENHICKKENIPYKHLYTIEKHNEEIVNISLSNDGNYLAAVLKSNAIAVYQILLSDRETPSRKFSIDQSSAQKERKYSNVSDKERKQSMLGNIGSGILLKKEHSHIDRSYSGLIRNDDKEKEKFYLEIKKINEISKVHETQITSIQWHSSDKYLVTSSKDQKIKLINPFSQSNPIIKIFEKHNSMVTSVIFCPKDNRILSIGLDQNIFSWTLEGSVELFKKTNSTVSEILYSPLLNYLISIEATNHSVLIYDYSTKQEVFKLQMNDAIISSAVSKIDKGGYLLVNSSKATPVLNLLNLSTKMIERKFFGHRQECFSIKCSFGGEGENFLVCGSEEAKIYVWNRYHSIPILAIKAHSAPVNTVIFPINQNLSNLIISCSDDHTIKFYSTDLISKAYFDDPSKILSNVMFVPGDKQFSDQPREQSSTQPQRNNIEEDADESHYDSYSD